MPPALPPGDAPRIAPAPGALRTQGWDDYALLDSGHGRKLERYGAWTVIRPEPQCLWTPALEPRIWEAAHATFEGGEDEEAGGWRVTGLIPQSWPLAWRAVAFNARLTAFRHLGFFPEQAANWSWLSDHLATAGKGMKILNLFGYTGIASLVAAKAGAAVTHVDASRKAIGWARENAELSGLSGAPVRWIVEDARKYVQRELRRGARYDGIILDPPKYGRGPGGEVWRLYEHLPQLIAACAELLSDRASFLLLNAYSERISGLALASLLGDALVGRGGEIAWGELDLTETAAPRGMGLSFFARWSAPGDNCAGLGQ